MKKLLITLSVVLLISITSFSQSNSINKNYSSIKWGTHGGIGITSFNLDDSLPGNAKLPFGGINFTYNPVSQFGIYSSLQISQRGDNTASTDYKYRITYVDFDLLPTFNAGKYFHLRAGLRYSYLLRSVTKEMTGNSGDGYSVSDEDFGIGNEIEAIAGISAELNDNLLLFFKYTLPYKISSGGENKDKNLPYSSFQIGINITPDIAEFSLPAKEYNTVPSDPEDRKKIKRLNINNDGLKVIPQGVFSISKLKELNAAKNELIAIPDEISRLDSLERLSIPLNNIINISDSITSLNKLKYLDLQYNNITSLPKDIGELKSLEFLFLGHNNLRELPESIVKLENLKYLQLGNNNLKKLPNNLFKLKNLVELDLRGTGILFLPEKISNLRNLERLYVDFSVPASIKANPRLKINPPEPPMGKLP